MELTKQEPEVIDVVEVEKVELILNEREEKIINGYVLKETIGRGSYGKVKRAIQKKTQKEYAIKVQNKVSLVKQRAVRYDQNGNANMINNLQKVYEEIEIWKIMNHRNVVKLYEVLDDPEQVKLYLVMELVNLGQVMHWDEETNVYSRNKEVLTYFESLEPSLKDQSEEKWIIYAAKKIFSQLADGLAYIHSKRIVHRDLKMENFLISREGVIKIIDFTVSKKLENEEDDICYDYEGTPSFTAPEVAFCSKEGYQGFLNDVWAFGVCLYLYIFGRLPFEGDSELEIQISAKNNQLLFPKSQSKELEKLFLALLNKDPSQRPSAAEIKKFEWFTLD